MNIGCTMNKVFIYLFFICCVSILFSCSKEYSFEQGNISPAEGSLWDSTSTCLPSTVHGTFYNGIPPGGDTAYVEIQVNVTKAGAYNITSDIQNGFQFLDSGFFSSTGINTIRLKPIGVPTIPVSTTFNINFDSSFCMFTVNVQDSTGTGLGGQDTTGTGGLNDTWQFTTGDGTFQGTFDTATIIKDTTVWGSGGQMLYLEGFKTNSNDTAIALYFYLPTGAIAPGSYSTLSVPPANASIFAFIDFDLITGDGTPIYEGVPSAVPGSNVTMTIDSYDDATHIVKGTFSGTAFDKNENPVINVTNGSFTATVTP